MLAGDVIGPTRQPLVLLAGYPAAVPETDLALRVDFQRPLDPCMRRSTNPPECYIRRGSGKVASNLGWIISNIKLRATFEQFSNDCLEDFQTCIKLDRDIFKYPVKKIQ